MSKTDDFPQTGDVIKSSNLICAVWSDIDEETLTGKGYLTLNRGRTSSPMGFYSKKVKIIDGVEYERKDTLTAELASYDPTRADALFVITNASMQGGSGGRDPYPDGWGMKLKRLFPDGRYNPDGEEIFCYLNDTGCFRDPLYLKNFEVLHTLKKKVSFE